MSLFTENSIIYKAMGNQDARDLLENIVDKDVLVKLDISNIIMTEVRAMKRRQSISCVYCPNRTEETLKEWAEKNHDARRILLFLEGKKDDGTKMVQTLHETIDHHVHIIYGIKEGTAEGGKLVGVFV